MRIWDMRSLKALYTIPAHTSNVSDIRFFRNPHGLPAPQERISQPATMDESNDPTLADDSTPAPEATSAAGRPPPVDRETEWRYRSGLYLASAGYDGYVKIWTADDWQLLRTLSTDSSKVMSVDLSPDAQLLASGTYNRNFQLFAPE